jgi:eukaryotic-like serine/threonine-protein kinase
VTVPRPATENATTTTLLRTDRQTRALYGDDLAAGAIVGAYRVESLVARGGFATVYRGRHLTLARTIALKVLHRDLARTSDMARRLLDEARVVNRIGHPGIVDIYDIGTLRDGRPYLVMEWLDGRSLDAELVTRGQLTAIETLAVMEDLLPALAAAHDAGVIHRDITAGNVIALPRGDWFVVKLVDFGIAKLVAGDGEEGGHHTSSDVRLGTPSHMAPEQIRGDTIDARTDVYGVGVLLFQLLTGRLPFLAGSSIELADLHMEAIAPRVSSLAVVPPALDAAVARCLCKLPGERWSGARELLVALRAAVTAEPESDGGRARDEAFAVHVECYVDDPDSAGAATFEAIEAVLARAAADVEAAGLLVVDRGPTELLALAFAEPHVDVLAVARHLAGALERRDGVDLAITVHAGTAVRGAGRREPVAGPMLAAGTWKARVPAREVQLTPAARRRFAER